MHPLVNELTELVMANEIHKAIQKMHHILSLSGSDLVNDVIVLSARFNQLQSDTRKGIVSQEHKNLQHAQITNGLIGLVDELKQEQAILDAYLALNNTLDQASKDRSLDLPVHLKDALYDRLADAAEQQKRIRILWIDNHPENNEIHVDLLVKSGQFVDCVQSSDEALTALESGQYHLIISDVSREGHRTKGIDFLVELEAQGLLLPTIFYTGHKDPSKGVPPYAFGLTDHPDELLHLVLDVIARGNYAHPAE